MPDVATVKTSKAAVGFRYCAKLFSLEKKYIYADVKARKDYLQNVVWPLLEEYFAWLKTIHPEKGSKLEDAVRCSLVETAKANGIEHYEYLMPVLSMLPYLGKSPAHKELETLMPWHPAVRHREHIRQ